MSDQNLAERLPHLEFVLWKIEDASTGLSGAADDYFLHKRKEVLLIYYMAAMLKHPDRSSGRRRARDLRQKVRRRSQILYKASNKQYFACLMLSLLGLNSKTITKMQKFWLYRKLAKYIH